MSQQSAAPNNSLVPTLVTIPSGQIVRLPNPPGAGGCQVVNMDSQYSVLLAPTSAFVPQQTKTLGPGLPTTWPEGPLWCQTAPGTPALTGVEVSVQPGNAIPLPAPAGSPFAVVGILTPGDSSVTIAAVPTDAVQLIVMNGQGTGDAITVAIAPGPGPAHPFASGAALAGNSYNSGSVWAFNLAGPAMAPYGYVVSVASPFFEEAGFILTSSIIAYQLVAD